MSFRKLNADGDNEMNWGKIAKYSAIALVVGAAIFVVYKKTR